MWLVVCTMWQMVGKWTAWSSSLPSFIPTYPYLTTRVHTRLGRPAAIRATVRSGRSGVPSNILALCANGAAVAAKTKKPPACSAFNRAAVARGAR